MAYLDLYNLEGNVLLQEMQDKQSKLPFHI